MKNNSAKVDNPVSLLLNALLLSHQGGGGPQHHRVGCNSSDDTRFAWRATVVARTLDRGLRVRLMLWVGRLMVLLLTGEAAISGFSSATPRVAGLVLLTGATNLLLLAGSRHSFLTD